MRYIRFVADDFKDLEKYDAAMELYDWVLELDPKDLNTHMNIGKIYQEQGNNKKAIQYFNKSLELLEAKKDDVSENFYNGVKEWLEEEMEGMK